MAIRKRKRREAAEADAAPRKPLETRRKVRRRGVSFRRLLSLWLLQRQVKGANAIMVS